MRTLQDALQSAGHLPADLRTGLAGRMGDVSEFMKELKQRFSKWFNKERNRFGTLWAERFKSVLVEDQPGAVQVVAAYVDLNPVRAGLVTDAYSGAVRTPIPILSGQDSGGCRTAFRSLPDRVPAASGQHSGTVRTEFRSGPDRIPGPPDSSLPP